MHVPVHLGAPLVVYSRLAQLELFFVKCLSPVKPTCEWHSSGNYQNIVDVTQGFVDKISQDIVDKFVWSCWQNVWAVHSCSLWSVCLLLNQHVNDTVPRTTKILQMLRKVLLTRFRRILLTSLISRVIRKQSCWQNVWAAHSCSHSTISHSFLLDSITCTGHIAFDRRRYFYIFRYVGVILPIRHVLTKVQHILGHMIFVGRMFEQLTCHYVFTKERRIVTILNLIVYNLCTFSNIITFN